MKFTTLLNAGIRASRVYTRMSSPVGFVARRFIRRSAGILGKPCRVCVDVGAGTAPYFQEITVAFGVEHYVALDIAPSDRTAVVADGRALPLQSASVDLIVTFDVIQHIPETEKVIGEIVRVLAPSGCVVVTFPFLYAECDFRDYQRWTLDGMSEVLTRHGMRILCAERRGGALFAAACALNWILQHAIPGQRTSWRQARTSLAVVRGAIVALLTVPTNIIAWIALGVDSLFHCRGAYMGGAVLAVKESTVRREPAIGHERADRGI